jgi:hypothetical protein
MASSIGEHYNKKTQMFGSFTTLSRTSYQYRRLNPPLQETPTLRSYAVSWEGFLSAQTAFFAGSGLIFAKNISRLLFRMVSDLKSLLTCTRA